MVSPLDFNSQDGLGGDGGSGGGGSSPNDSIHDPRKEPFHSPPTGSSPVTSSVIIPPEDIVTLPTQPPPARPIIHLRDGIRLSQTAFGRTYVKGTQRVPEDGELEIFNQFADLDVTIALEGAAGVTFSPNLFDLHRGTSARVIVRFDPNAMETLPEGVSVVTAVLSLGTHASTWRPIQIDDPKRSVPVTTPDIGVGAPPDAASGDPIGLRPLRPNSDTGLGLT